MKSAGWIKRVVPAKTNNTNYDTDIGKIWFGFISQNLFSHRPTEKHPTIYINQLVSKMLKFWKLVSILKANYDCGPK